MNNIFSSVLIASSIFLSGCNFERERKFFNMLTETNTNAIVTEKKTENAKHVKSIWKQDMMELDEIDGHLYIVGRISKGYHGSYGVCSIVHSPSCSCHKDNHTIDSTLR